jgi:hypothetical protein
MFLILDLEEEMLNRESLRHVYDIPPHRIPQTELSLSNRKLTTDFNANQFRRLELKRKISKFVYFSKISYHGAKVRVSVMLAITGCSKSRKASFGVVSDGIMPVPNFNKIGLAVRKLKHEDRQTRPDPYIFILCRSSKERIKGAQ